MKVHTADLTQTIETIPLYTNYNFIDGATQRDGRIIIVGQSGNEDDKLLIVWPMSVGMGKADDLFKLTDLVSFGACGSKVGVTPNGHTIILNVIDSFRYVRWNLTTDVRTSHLIGINGGTTSGCLTFMPHDNPLLDVVLWSDREHGTRLNGGPRMGLPSEVRASVAFQNIDGNDELMVYKLQDNKTYKVNNQLTRWPKLVQTADDKLIVAGMLDGRVAVYTEPFEPLNVTGGLVPYIPPQRFDKKLWFAPFFSVGKYGDREDMIGNALLVVEKGVVGRVGPRGVPLIVSSDAYDPAFQNTTVAYYASGGNMEDLRKDYERLLLLPEKPIIVYLDSRDWPDDRPTWMLANRTWLGVQAYRNKGENLETFTAHMRILLDDLAKWNLPIALVPQFYDRNGTVTLSDCMANLPVFDGMIQGWNVVAVLPFADRRPGGMIDYAVLETSCRNFANKHAGRPNRYDYWLPSETDLKTVLTNKLSQMTNIISLTDAEKAYIKERL